MDAVELTCPHCAYSGRAKAAPADGAKIRCPRCRVDWVHDAADGATLFEVEAASASPGIQDRVRKLERRNRALVVGLVGLAALQALGIGARFRPSASAPGAMEIKGELGVGKLTALDVVARRVTVVGPKGETMGVLDGGAPTGETYATLVLANSESKCTSRLDSDGIDFRDVNGRARASLWGGERTDSSGLALRDPNGETLLGFHADPSNVFASFADGSGRARIQMGFLGGRSMIEYRPPDSRDFINLAR